MLTRIAAALACTVCLVGCAGEERTRNLVLISLDTTRQDHMSLYGYERDTTPRLKRLGERSTVFENAVAQMMVTNPSHASMLTGLYPHTHLVGENTRRLHPRFVTLTEILANRGYTTGAFVSGAPLKRGITGIDQGFDVYDDDLGGEQRDGRVTTARALEWLAGLDPSQPYFLMLHLYDAHGPYEIEDEYLDLFRSPDRGPQLPMVPHYQVLENDAGERMYRRNDYVDRYDALIRLQDDLIGRVLDAVDLDETVIVVVADHGETIDERGARMTLNHGHGVYREQSRIPLLIYVPGGRASRPVQPVETVDILPTVLELLGGGPAVGVTLEGESLVPLMQGEGPDGERSLAFASSRNRFPEHGDIAVQRHGWIHSVRTRRWKLIEYPALEGTHLELYDLAADPWETRNVADANPEIVVGLVAALAAWRREGPNGEGEPEISEELRRELEALGYVGN